MNGISMGALSGLAIALAIHSVDHSLLRSLSRFLSGRLITTTNQTMDCTITEFPGETHLIIKDVSWWKNVRLMLGFTHISAGSDKVGTLKLL